MTRRSGALLVSASAWTLGLTARVIQPGETPEGILEQLAKRLGLPAVRAATRQAMRLLGSHFVLGQTIEEALDRAGSHREFLYSFDMLGEGARTAGDAARYFQSYADAIEAIGTSAGNDALPKRPGISVKLSALHPRYEPLSRDRVMKELAPRLLELARLAKSHRSQFHRRRRGSRPARTVARRDRRDVARSVARRLGRFRPRGAGLSEARRRGDRLGRRRCRGARSPHDGASGQGRLLGHRDQARAGARARRLSGVHPQGDDRPLLPRLRAQAAGGAAATLSAVRHAQCAHRCERDGADAGGGDGYEFQRLHGMGEALYQSLHRRRSGARRAASMRRSAAMRDLLAYLVRRLLENGANSSFVSVAADPNVPVAGDPEAAAGLDRRSRAQARHPRIPLPRDLYGRSGTIRAGVEFGDRARWRRCWPKSRTAPANRRCRAAGRRRGRAGRGRAVSRRSMARHRPVQRRRRRDCRLGNGRRAAGFPAWNATPVVDVRAAVLDARRRSDRAASRRV